VFQSSEVRGAVCSGLFELDKRANGVSFWGGCSRVFTVEDLEMVFEGVAGVGALGRDHSLR